LIFLDLDRFKNINDSLGHSAGDVLLQTIAKRLKQCLRNIDTLSRLGGDEFVILIDSLTGIEEITVISNRIIESITQKMTLHGTEVSITASMGVVVFSDQYKNASEIISDADIAMYQAKRNTIRRYEIFNNEMRQKVEARIRVETEIHRALTSNEFELFYQPILSVKELALESFEALIRWNKPGKGYLYPIDFIPIAEETGLILPIGHWVLREACKQIAAWKEIVPPEKNIVVNINLSARQFLDPQLCTQIQECMNEFQIEGKNLILEITETAIIEEKEKVIKTLTELRGWGIQVQIDDFGTGYSSLSYLHSLPFDALKIDRSFITQMCSNGDSTSIDIIQTIISLSKDLKKSVIAEGVETQRELEMLTNMGCGYFQGYLVSRPVNKNEAVKFFEEEITKYFDPDFILAQ
jgi:diguanylate cyclase (GGDEF)-like protein